MGGGRNRKKEKCYMNKILLFQFFWTYLSLQGKKKKSAPIFASMAKLYQDKRILLSVCSFLLLYLFIFLFWIDLRNFKWKEEEIFRFFLKKNPWSRELYLLVIYLEATCVATVQRKLNLIITKVFFFLLYHTWNEWEK